jgi:putative peptidoglycan binding protein
MASRVISILATLAIVAGMVAPALAQSSGGSTGTGSAPATGSGGSTPTTPLPPSATQSGSTTLPSTPPAGTGSGVTGKSKSGMGTTSAPRGSTSSPSAGRTSAPSMGSTSESGMSTNGSAGAEQVKAVQKALQDKGMDPGPIDGVMGPQTMAALKAFQKDQKLSESGRLDDQTREKLGVSR